MAFGDLNSLALMAGSILCSQAGLSLCPRAGGAPAAPEDLPEGVMVRPQPSVLLPHAGQSSAVESPRESSLISLSLGSLCPGAGHPPFWLPVFLLGEQLRHHLLALAACAGLWTGLCLSNPASTGWAEIPNTPGTRGGHQFHQSHLGKAVPDLSISRSPELSLC